jgi:hypothetical protein
VRSGAARAERGGYQESTLRGDSNGEVWDLEHHRRPTAHRVARTPTRHTKVRVAFVAVETRTRKACTCGKMGGVRLGLGLKVAAMEASSRLARSWVHRRIERMYTDWSTNPCRSCPQERQAAGVTGVAGPACQLQHSRIKASSAREDAKHNVEQQNATGAQPKHCTWSGERFKATLDSITLPPFNIPAGGGEIKWILSC